MPVTYCRISTDDQTGTVRGYLGQARVTEDRVESFGGYGVVQVPRFQQLLRYICQEGFEHHVALNPALVAEPVNEALSRYLGWNIYHHRE
jgi:L-fucose isomerase-like protein